VSDVLDNLLRSDSIDRFSCCLLQIAELQLFVGHFSRLLRRICRRCGRSHPGRDYCAI
jgi:hypothetical protein